MSFSPPKDYQRDAVKNALDIFRYTESQIQLSPDEASRRTASAFNGCILLEAPTGSGKTRMAGMIAEEFSRVEKHKDNSKIVWFWFTPFAGLVEQTKIAMKAQFQGLRVRDLQSERTINNISSGDLFVTTWASVAATNASSRRLRKNGDLSVSLDEFIPMLRGLDFRIGVVVDESHHGFTKAAEAVKVYRDILSPDFTLLITATPDDSDIERFSQAAGIENLHRIRVSRRDAVDAGLIKEGIKSVAYLAPEEQKSLVDFALTALSDAWHMHCTVKNQLLSMGIDLIPLMLVQVGNTDKSVEEAKDRLKLLGVPEDSIAWYTAEDPNDDLLAVAKDESKQVLIFKVAVALGFDAPRAFTLVSLRGAQDTDFGIQVVGRILRVHPALQLQAKEKSLPELLRFGYVFLADAENQTGLTSAGDKINSIKTEISGICPYTMVVQIAGENTVQVLENGQASLLPQTFIPTSWIPIQTSGSPNAIPVQSYQGILSSLVSDAISASSEKSSSGGYSILAGNKLYPIKGEIPKVYKTEILPLSTDKLVQCVGASIVIDDRVFGAGLRRNVQITRQQINIFEDEDSEVEQIQARLSDAEVARRAQGVLFDAQHIDPRDLYDVLIKRLTNEYKVRGIDADENGIMRSLYLIMATFPNLVKKAARHCAAQYRELIDTSALPDAIELPNGALKSRLNIYGVMPQDLNRPERAFAELLDADTSGTVEWWFRNEPRKPWSIGIVMPDGDRYFPDFAIKVKDRSIGGGLLLVEAKGAHILNYDDTLDKVIAEHKVYRRPLMLMQEPDGRFVTIRYNERTDKNEADQIFRIDNLSQY